MKRLVILAALAAAACQPVPDTTTPPAPVRVGMSDADARARVEQILAAAGCTMSFDAYQDQLDLIGLDPAEADPTVEAGQLLLANRRIMEVTIQEMAEEGVLRRSGWTFTSQTGACA